MLFVCSSGSARTAPIDCARGRSCTAFTGTASIRETVPTSLRGCSLMLCAVPKTPFDKTSATMPRDCDDAPPSAATVPGRADATSGPRPRDACLWQIGRACSPEPVMGWAGAKTHVAARSSGRLQTGGLRRDIGRGAGCGWWCVCTPAMCAVPADAAIACGAPALGAEQPRPAVAPKGAAQLNAGAVPCTRATGMAVPRPGAASRARGRAAIKP
mmetsp:Transcript_83126/g.231846  ORF Transcript_83126/g.231846 Transcript_83126/m.231846 type:complete len:214 (+) Transcript_83126:772-1413(+)